MPEEVKQKVAGEITPLENPSLRLTRIGLMPSFEVVTDGADVKAAVGRLVAGEKKFELASLDLGVFPGTELFVEAGLSFRGNSASVECAHRVIATGKGSIGYLDPEHEGPGGIERGEITDLSLRLGAQAVLQTVGLRAHVRALTFKIGDVNGALLDLKAGVLENTRIVANAMLSFSNVSVSADKAYGSLMIIENNSPVAIIE